MEYPATRATVETFANGLTLILDPDATAPVVSAQLWVETGSMHEDEHLGSGLSHFLEHMVFKGTRDFSGDELADTVQEAGGHWNAYTTFDRTVYYIDGPSASLPVFLKCLTGLVFYPTLPEDEFEKEKDVIRREIDMGLDDPDNVATRLAFSTVFQKDPRRHPVIGHRHLFDGLAYADLKGYHRRRYTTDRCFVVISGDFDAAEAKAAVMGLTDGCVPGCGREPWMAQDPPPLGPRFARAEFAIPNSRISMMWKMPELEHADAAVYDVLAAMLGRGRSSRLYRTLREQSGLALEISSFSWTGPGRAGLFAIGADTPPEKREELVAAVHAQIAALQVESLDGDLAKAKRQIATTQFRSLTTASGRATDLASNWHEARDLDFTRSHVAAIQAVSAGDVRRVAALLDSGKMTLTVLDPLGAPEVSGSGRAVLEKEGVRVRVLPNGVRLALIPDRRVPLVHLQAVVKSGLPAETPENQGIRQLFATCLPKGTATRSAAEIALAMESLGASCSAGTGNNAILVQAGGLAPDLEAIAGVFCEVLTAPVFSGDVMDREKASQIAALEEAAQDPLHLCFRTLRAAMFQESGYGLDSLGTRASLEGITREDLVRHHAGYFNTANLTLAVAGDFEEEQVVELFAKGLAGLSSGSPWVPPASRLEAGIEVERHLDKKQAVIAIGFPGAGVSDEDRHALAMIQEYASDMAGPLFTRIREELGLAYQVGASQFLGYDCGMFAFYLATSPEQADLAEKEMLAEIRKIAQGGIPVEVLDRVKATVLSGLAIQQQSSANVARTVSLDLMFGHEADQYRRMAEIYQNLTAEGVRGVAARVFSADPVIAVVRPEAEA